MGNEFQALSATSVIGNQVLSSRGENLGRIEELVIDPDTGRIVGALLSRRNGGEADHLAAVPWEALTLSRADRSVFVNSEAVEQSLRQIENWPKLGTPQRSRNIVVYTSSVHKGID